VFDSVNVREKKRGIAGRIVIRNLSFGYDEREVLQNIDLDIPAGTSLGIMGKPGSGKSTLISLLFRLFPIEHGEIRVDDIRITNIPLAVLRASIGYVPQDPFLFSDTIGNNIAFGLDEDERDFEEIVRYAQMTALYDEIMSFGKGFETLVGERGVTLSGGQKQRLSIARALIVKPRILVLDDALSSVDARAEQDILRNIRAEMEGRTTIIISHRVSTVRECDSIAVIDGGTIFEQGSHEELYQRDGYYRRLFDLQRLEGKVSA
jgi:ATP-binding cassette subfamily B protein